MDGALKSNTLEFFGRRADLPCLISEYRYLGRNKFLVLLRDPSGAKLASSFTNASSASLAFLSASAARAVSSINFKSDSTFSLASAASPPTSSIQTPNAIAKVQTTEVVFSTLPEGIKMIAMASPINPIIIIQSPTNLSRSGDASDNSEDRSGSFKW